VILTARRFDELEKVRVGLLNPDQHISICADITDAAQVRHAYEQVLQKKGRIDWLINNAGLSQRALIADTSMQTERAIMEVDFQFSLLVSGSSNPLYVFVLKFRDQHHQSSLMGQVRCP
jgi:NADP-dependent 3-hydroxy acid dehydrogenase YdfG